MGESRKVVGGSGEGDGGIPSLVACGTERRERKESSMRPRFLAQSAEETELGIELGSK